jgi:hypothetical protein
MHEIQEAVMTFKPHVSCDGRLCLFLLSWIFLSLLLSDSQYEFNINTHVHAFNL